MFARPPAHRHKLECDHIGFRGSDGCKVIGKTQVLSATLVDRLAWKRKSESLSGFVVVIDDEVVTARMTRIITVYKFCLEQLFANRLGFYLRKLWENRLFNYLRVFFGRLSSLFELPLSFEKGGLIYVRKYLCEVGDLDDPRAVERSCRDLAAGGNFRADSMRRVAFRARRDPRRNRTKLCVFANQIFFGLRIADCGLRISISRHCSLTLSFRRIEIRNPQSEIRIC